DDEDDGAVADMNNLDTTIQVSPISTIRIHKDHPLDQVIGDFQSATQTRKMSKNLDEHGFKEFLQFKLQKVWTFVDLPNGKRVIGSKWVFKNKKDENGIMIRNKARLVAQGYTQEEGIDYDKVFAPVARIEVIRLFLAYASFKDFAVYQVDVKSDFLYRKIEEEVYKKDGTFISQDKYVDEILKKFRFTEVKTVSTHMETQKPLLNDKDGEEVDVHMYRSMISSLMYLTSSRHDIMFAVCACARYQVNPKVAYTDSDYAGASLDRKSTTRDGKKIIVTGSSVRRDLQLVDEEDEVVNKELSDSLVRAATTASSLEAKQDSGGGPRCQETIKDTTTQTRFGSVSKQSNDSPLARESSRDEASLGEDASKQERRINVIDADEDITLVNDADNEMFDVNVLGGEEMFVAGQNENVVEEVVDAAQVSTAATTVIITTEEITLAQALEALKTSKPRLDEEAAKKLQDKFDEKERLAKEKSEKEERANIALIEE
nr:ribonuclease H-like domain-containing protein [Tanacetum cinerariifolium]